MTTTITRPACATCWFYISVGTDVGECRRESPKAGSLASVPTVTATYWCGQFVLPPVGAVVETQDDTDPPPEETP